MQRSHFAKSGNDCDRAELACAHALQALPASELAAVGAHIASCGHCQRELESLRPTVDRFVAWPTDVLRPTTSLRERLARRIAGETGKEPGLPPARRWAEPEWQQVGPGIECKLLATDTGRHRVGVLVRLAPGANYPAHTHAGAEELYLLDGELWIDARKLFPGDYNYGAPGEAHERVWSETGCTCLLITSTRDALRWERSEVNGQAVAVEKAAHRRQFTTMLEEAGAGRSLEEGRRALQALRKAQEIEADLRMLLDSAAEGLCSINREGAVTLCNASFLRMTGFQRNEVEGKDFQQLIHHSRADGSPYPRADCPVLKAAQAGTHAHATDEVFYRADGTGFPVEYWARPIIREGRIEGAACTFVDITERKQEEARQQLLNHELAHRVKNTLAVVQAIVSQTLRNSGAPKDAIHAINARLSAMRQAHDVLMRRRWDGAPIIDVVESGIAVHGPQHGRIRIEGPRIDVGPKSAFALTMALNELCINAIKYGALSNHAGNVALDWTLGEGAASGSFHMRWKERGGPPVTPPASTGFGSWIIGEYCKSELDAGAALLFAPDGLEWTLDVPLTSLKK